MPRVWIEVLNVQPDVEDRAHAGRAFLEAKPHVEGVGAAIEQCRPDDRFVNSPVIGVGVGQVQHALKAHVVDKHCADPVMHEPARNFDDAVPALCAHDRLGIP